MDITLRFGEVLTVHAPDGGDLHCSSQSGDAAKRVTISTQSRPTQTDPALVPGGKPYDGKNGARASGPEAIIRKSAVIGKVTWKPELTVGKFEEIG